MLERTAKEGNSPVVEINLLFLVVVLEYLETRVAWGNPAELTAKAKYIKRSIVNKYREGKVKSSPLRAVK